MGNIGSLYAYIGADTSGLSMAQRNVASFATTAKARFKSIGMGTKALTGSFIAMGVAATAAYAKIISSGMKYEKTMAVVKGVTRATATEFQALESITKELGATTEWTATQAAEGLKFLSMAGFAVGDSIRALPSVLDLATAGNIDLGRAADITTNALTAMGMSVEELGKVNDTFVATITRTNTDMDMMAESFKYAAPVAKAFGYSIDELATMIGLLGNAGVQGSMAGTQLAFAMQKSAIYAKEAGLENMKFMDVLRQLNKEQVGQTEMMDIFSMRGGRAALILRDVTDKYETLNKSVKNSTGESEELATTMRDTLPNSFALLGSALDGVSKKLYKDVFRDDLKGTIDSITTSINDMSDSIVFIAQVIKFPFDLLGTIWDALQAAFYLLVTALVTVGVLVMELVQSLQELQKVSSNSKIGKMMGWEWTIEDEKTLKKVQGAKEYLLELGEKAQNRAIGNYADALGYGDIDKERRDIEENMNAIEKSIEERRAAILNKKVDAELDAVFGSVDIAKAIMDVDVAPLTKEVRQTYKKMYEDMDYYGQEWVDNQKELYTIEAEAMEKATGDKLTSQKWLKDQIEKLTSIDEVNKRVDIGLDNFFEDIDKAEELINDQYDSTEAFTNDRLQAYRSMYGDMKKYTQRYYDFEERLIDEQAKQYLKAGVEEVEVTKWTEEEKRKLTKDRLVNTGGFTGGVQAAIMDMEDYWDQHYQRVGKLGADTYTGLYNAINDTLFNGLQGDFDELSDIWDNMWENMTDGALRLITDMVTKMAMEEIVIPVMAEYGGMIKAGVVGAGLYGTVGNMIGLPQGGGAQVGAGVGGAIGSNFGAWGSIIGTVGGGLLGSLFGGDDNKGPSKQDQIIAALNSFVDSMEDIVAQNTLEDWELSMRNINKWYEEQALILDSLGLNLSQNSDALEALNNAYNAQVEALIESMINSQDSLMDLDDALKQFSNYVDTIDNFIAEMTVSEQFAPAVSADQMQNRFDELYASAQGGGMDELGELTSFTQSSFLPFMQSLGGNYQELFDDLFGVNGKFEQLKQDAGDAIGDPYEMAYAEMIEAMEEQNAISTAMSQSLLDIIDEIRSQTLDLVTVISDTETAQAVIDEITNVIDDVTTPDTTGNGLNTLDVNQINDLISYLADITNIEDTYQDSDTSGFAQFFSSWEEYASWAMGMGIPATALAPEGLFAMGYDTAALNEILHNQAVAMWDAELAANLAMRPEPADNPYEVFDSEANLIAELLAANQWGNVNDLTPEQDPGGFLLNTFTTIKNGIQEFFSDRLQDYQELWQGVTSGDIPSILKLIASISGISLLAKGGMVSSPTIAEIGEKGEEYIVPTYNPERDKFLQSVGVNSEVIAGLISSQIGDSGQSQNVVVNIDGNKLLDIIIEKGSNDPVFQKQLRGE